MSIVASKAGNAFVTLLLNDSYLPGALVLAKSLRETHTDTPLVILYVKKELSDDVYNEIQQCGLFDRTIAIDGDVLGTRNRFELDHLLQRTELSNTMSKLNVWRLVDYSKVIYLDSDTLIVDNIDHLFERDLPIGGISAASDSGWPDIFNSGVFITKPDLGIYDKLLKFYQTEDSFDGADQGILNEFFNLQSDKMGTYWDRLPFIYNCTLNSNYEYLPAMIRFKNDIKVFHFIGKLKPWINRSISWSNSNYPKIFGGDDNGLNKKNLFELWWDIYDKLADKSSTSTTKILEISGHLQSRLQFNESIDMAGPINDLLNQSSPPIPDFAPPSTPRNDTIQNKMDDVSTIHFPMYYYKHNDAQPIVDESSKGEAWKLQESKIEWSDVSHSSHTPPNVIIEEEQQEQKQDDLVEIDEKYQAHVHAIDNYVINNPIFPWEGKTLKKKPSRTFDNLNKFEPPSYSIAIMDSLSSASSFDECAETDSENEMSDPDNETEDKLIGFNNGYKFEKYLKKVENFQSSDRNESVDSAIHYEDDVVENLEEHAALDIILDNVLHGESATTIDKVDKEEEGEEPNLAEDRIEKGLDNLQIDGN